MWSRAGSEKGIVKMKDDNGCSGAGKVKEREREMYKAGPTNFNNSILVDRMQIWADPV